MRLDGEPLELTPDGDDLTVRPADLTDGRHDARRRGRGRRAVRHRRDVARHRFTVDTTPPVLTLPDRLDAGSLREELTVTGGVEGADEVRVNGTPAAVSGSRFEATLPSPPATVDVEARTRPGTPRPGPVDVHVTHPAMRGVHMTALAWTAASLREPILKMAREGRIDTVQLDIKDEDGLVGYDTEVALARPDRRGEGLLRRRR